MYSATKKHSTSGISNTMFSSQRLAQMRQRMRMRSLMADSALHRPPELPSTENAPGDLTSFENEAAFHAALRATAAHMNRSYDAAY